MVVAALFWEVTRKGMWTCTGMSQHSRSEGKPANLFPRVRPYELGKAGLTTPILQVLRTKDS